MDSQYDVAIVGGGYIGLWMINAANARSITLEAGRAKRLFDTVF